MQDESWKGERERERERKSERESMFVLSDYYHI